MKGLAGIIDSALCRMIVSAHRPPLPADSTGEAPGFLLGQSIPRRPSEPATPVFVTDAERRKHLYAIGATGCGKSNLLVRLIDDDYLQRRTVAVLDLRGDLIDRIIARLGRRPDFLDRAVLLDLRRDNRILGFNPLAGSGDPFTRAYHLLDVLRHNADSWGVQLEETLRNSLLALTMGGCSLSDLEPLLSDKVFRSTVLRSVADQQVLSFFSRYEALTAVKQQDFSLPVFNKATPLLGIPQVRQVLRSTDGINWQEVLDTPGRLILVALAAHKFFSASHLVGGLVVSAIQNAAMARTDQAQGERNPMTLIIDEFENMASEAFCAIIAEGRRYGLSLVLSHQNLDQLERELCAVIRNNVHLQLFFQTGTGDASSLSGDLVGFESKEQARQALISQDVGQAILVQRSKGVVAVQTVHDPDPPITPGELERIKTQVLDRTVTDPPQEDKAVDQDEPVVTHRRPRGTK